MLECMGKSPWWIVTIVCLLHLIKIRAFNPRLNDQGSINETWSFEKPIVKVDNSLGVNWKNDPLKKHSKQHFLKIFEERNEEVNDYSNDQYDEEKNENFIKIDDVIYSPSKLEKLSAKVKYQNLFMPKNNFLKPITYSSSMLYHTNSEGYKVRKVRSKEKKDHDNVLKEKAETKGIDWGHQNENANNIKIARVSRENIYDFFHTNFTFTKRNVPSSNSSSEKRSHVANIRHQKSRRNFIRTRKSPRTRTSSGKLEPTEVPSLVPPTTQRTTTEKPKLSWQESDIRLLDPEVIIMDANEDITQETNNEALYDPYHLYDSSRINDSMEIIHEDTDDQQKQIHNDQMDVVTKFLRIIESQHLMGDNCTKGTDFNLGEGVVDSYAQDMFKLEAETAVNRANLYTRLWKYTKEQVLMSEYLLHAEVLSIIEFDEDIFAAGNCYDKHQYKDYMLFCPFAYRLPEGSILVKDLSVEYKYLSASFEFFFFARRSAERVIKNHNQFKRGYHSYQYNDSVHSEREEEEILAVTYEDGTWSKPYYDCGGGNIWMMTYTVPFFGFANNTYHFKGTSGIDIDLRRVDIDQCPIPKGSKTLNIFANSDKCKKKTTMCKSIKGLGFRRGSYKCVCKKGFYFPEVHNSKKYFNGSHIEEEYEKKMLGEPSLYDVEGVFECFQCAEGCETCDSPTPCVVSLNWVMRTCILAACLIIILTLPVILFFTWKYGNLKVVRAASPVLLRIIIGGAFFIYSTTLVLYPIPSVISCSVRVWLREIGFSLAYGALMLKTWRISVIFRVRSAKAVKITDLDLMKRLGVIVGVFAVFLGIRTIVAPPQVIVSMTADDLKAYLCSTDWWDHSFTFMEMMFLVWGIRLCIVVRKAPSEFNESKFISIAIYNEFLLSLFLNVSIVIALGIRFLQLMIYYKFRLFLQSPANPDLLYIIFFCHTQLTMTPLIALIFGSKAVLVVKGLDKGEESISMTKPMTAKFLQKAKTNSHNMASVTSTSGYSFEGDMQEEFKKIYLHLDFLRERNARVGNRQLVAKIIAMQQAAQELIPIANEATNRENAVAVNPVRKSETKVSDGIVMKPHVNNILANVTDKIVCATFQETPEGLSYSLSRECVKLKSISDEPEDIGVIESNCDSIVHPSESLIDDKFSTQDVCSDCSPSSLFGGQRFDSLSGCCSPMSYNSPCSSPLSKSSNNFLSREGSFRRRRCHSDFGDSLHFSCKHFGKRNCHSLSERKCRSLENLLMIPSFSYHSMLQKDDIKIWSCQSTPRSHKKYAQESTLFRHIKNPIRARAFILYSLSGKNSFGDEVTV